MGVITEVILSLGDIVLTWSLEDTSNIFPSFTAPQPNIKGVVPPPHSNSYIRVSKDDTDGVCPTFPALIGSPKSVSFGVL